MLLAAVTQTADEGFRIHDILRAVSGALEVPVIVLLVLFLLAAAALVGWLIAESCTERRHLKLALPALMETLRTAPDRELRSLVGSEMCIRDRGHSARAAAPPRLYRRHARGARHRAARARAGPV